MGRLTGRLDAQVVIHQRAVRRTLISISRRWPLTLLARTIPSILSRFAFIPYSLLADSPHWRYNRINCPVCPPDGYLLVLPSVAKPRRTLWKGKAACAARSKPRCRLESRSRRRVPPPRRRANGALACAKSVAAAPPYGLSFICSQVSTELTEPTAESVQLSKTLAEMQSLDEHDTAEVCIPWRSGFTATPTPPRLLQLRGVVSLRIRLTSSRTSMWRSRSFGQASLLRAVIVS